MSTRVVLGAALLVALVAPLAPAQAACEIGDLAGRWRAYMVGVNASGRSFVQECSVTANSEGEFRPARCAGRTTTLSASGLEVARNCRLTGTFILELPNRELECDVRAQISISKEIIAGGVTCDEDVFLLNMLRR
jgi:hypothetical protein